MKKRTLNISKLNLKKEVISNLNEIKGGVIRKPQCYWWDEDKSGTVGSYHMYTGRTCDPRPEGPACAL